MNKVSLRKEALARRASYSPAALSALSVSLQDKILRLPEFARAHVLATYVGKDGEVDTRRIIERALAEGKRVLVPLTFKAQGELAFSELHDLEKDLTLGSFGILEPRPESVRLVDLGDAELVLVPGLAWDTRGYRLGYGKGYFDKALVGLAETVTLVGLSFEFQLVPNIPEQKHDIPVHIIVTEQRIVRCRQTTRAT